MQLKYVPAILFISLLFLVKVSGQPVIPADPKKIESRIQELGAFGDSAEGVRKRVAFGKGDIEVRKHITALMQAAGLAVTIDAAGNIIGRRKGNDPSLPYLSFGSHTDAVPGGGIYDGDLGVVAAIECIELLNQKNIITNHPLEVIDFVDEEGGLIGSRAMIGQLSADGLASVTNSGKTVRQGILDIGGKPDQLGKAKRNAGDMDAFLELHIEQGGTLEKEHINIGVVTGIVGIESWTVVVDGMANHAGTTPMNLRKDALLAAAKLMIAVNEIISGIPGAQVGTFGQISVLPGATNVIPGKATMSLEIRDLSDEKLAMIFNKIKEKADSIALSSGTKISFMPNDFTKPALTDQRIRDMIVASAKESGLTYKLLPSGALHDTQDMSRIAPAGMIFVPSKNGISHSPEEYTSPTDMANGVTILLRTILKIDAIK